MLAPSRLLALYLGLFLAGCATVEKVGRDLLKENPKGREVLAQFDEYKRLAKKFKAFHDGKGLDPRALLDLFDQLRQKPGKSPQRYSGAWRWPLESGVVSSEYGPRWGRSHEGLDIAAKSGVPLYTIAPGRVVYSDNKLRGYGNVVIVQHDKRTLSLYAHNKRNLVRKGDWISANQMIARLGSTGKSTGPHVHFEMRRSNKPIPPRSFLPKSRF